MILIVGHRPDPHLKSVIQSLEQKKHEFIVIDSYANNSDGFSYEIAKRAELRLRGFKNSEEKINSIWWRQKPRFTVPAHDPTALYDYYFIHREWNQVIDYLGVELADTFSINDRERAAVANNKATQLKFAVEAGFQIPPTLISNDFASIRDFISGADGYQNNQYIYKPFTPYMPPSGMITYASIINRIDIDDKRDQLASAPGIFQKFVNKKFELRINIVGDDIFAAKIDSKFSEKTQVDWRQDQFNDMYSHFDLDEGFGKKLLKLHKKFGLFFGAYDFIVTEDDVPVFLEVNPAGQWMWLEMKLRHPIGERIADALAKADLP